MTSRNRATVGLALVLALSALLGWRLLAEEERGVKVAELPVEPVESHAGSSAEVDLPTPTIAEQRSGADSTLPVIIVQREDGTPVAEADVVIFEDTKALANLVTDSSGSARYDDLQGAARVVVRAAGHAFVVTDLDPADRPSTIILPDGKPFHGRVEVDGAPPVEPLELQLQSEANRTLVAELPLSVRVRLGGSSKERNAIPIWPEADGTFVVRGLSPGDHGRFEWRGPWISADAPDKMDQRSTLRLSLDGSTVLKLSRPIDLRLRLARSDGGATDGATVTIRDGEHVIRTRIEDGVFIGKSPRGPARTIVAQVNSHGKIDQSIDFQLELPAEITDPWYLGKLVLPAPRVLRIEVVDAEGNSIPEPSAAEGAVVMEGRLSESWRIRADYDPEIQRLIVELDPSGTGFFVAANGYGRKWVEVPESGDDLRVVLSRVASLSVEFPGFQTGKRELSLMLHGWQRLVADEHPSARGDSLVSTPTVSANASPLFQIPLDTNWTRTDLIPGVPMRLEVRDRRSRNTSRSLAGGSLAQVEIAPLAPGEHRELVLDIGLRSRTLKLLVIDSDGAPVPRAYVSLNGANDESRDGPRTDSKGKLEIKPLYGDVVDLWVWAKDFPMCTRYDVPIETGEVTVVLDVARTLAIEVEAKAGFQLPSDCVVVVELKDNTDRIAEGGPRRWTASRLPHGEVTIWVHANASRVSQVHDTQLGYAKVVVGEPGRVLATHRAGPTTPDRVRALVVASAETGKPISRTSPEWQMSDGSGRYELNGLPLGSYDAWLEEANYYRPGEWTRVGLPKRILLDLENPSVEVDLSP